MVDRHWHHVLVVVMSCQGDDGSGGGGDLLADQVMLSCPGGGARG